MYKELSFFYVQPPKKLESIFSLLEEEKRLTQMLLDINSLPLSPGYAKYRMRKLHRSLTQNQIKLEKEIKSIKYGGRE